MRVYSDFLEAKNEIRRDLNELGVTVYAGYQSLEVDMQETETRELTDYDCRIITPRLEDLNPTQPWATIEWEDRLSGILGKPQNPGRAWKHRSQVWEPLLEDVVEVNIIDGGPEKLGFFSYTYSDRLFAADVPDILLAMHKNLSTRQGYIGIWNPNIDGRLVGKRRVPCSLGYHLRYRSDRLEMTYTMRSIDFLTHWNNDLWLALKLQQYCASVLEVKPGPLTHCVGSLHVYAHEVAGTF